MKTREEIIDRLKALKPVLKEEFHIDSLVLFGSYATKRATVESDLDILIETDKEAREIYALKQRLKRFLSQELGIKKIDIARKKYLKPYAKTFIMRDSVNVF